MAKKENIFVSLYKDAKNIQQKEKTMLPLVFCKYYIINAKVFILLLNINEVS